MMSASKWFPRHWLVRACRWLLVIGVGLLAAAGLAPFRAHAAIPISVQTIVSRSGARWNAPATSQHSFASYLPSVETYNSRQVYQGAELALTPLAIFSPSSIIGPDKRVQVTNTRDFPYRTVVLIEVEFEFGIALECSGWMIGPQMVGTAGHCVYDPSLGWAEHAHISPAANGDKAPFGTDQGSDFFTVQGWIDSGEPEFDYGAILLNSAVGNRTGWMGMAVLDLTEIRSRAARVTGYPADKPFHTMWTMDGRITRVSPLRLFYAIDTYPGQSGAPLYNAEPSRACLSCVTGVHGYGTQADPKQRLNSGVRVTQPVFENYLAWRTLQ